MGIIVTSFIGLATFLDIYWLVFFQKNISFSSESHKTTGIISTSNQSSASSNISDKNGKYKDGVYTGNTISTIWGDVQTQITILNGKIVSVKVLEYPDKSKHSQQVNSIAIPQYTNEVIKLGSAKIQSISGATVTYGGYTQSLQSALDQAV